ncbi:MAG TPA: CARDB domain-containing protein [Candidatus Paceibacterota bacterium]|nr:CARDB domain-containing protein [Candidatus Paceibacterota bacterium]
MKKYKIFLSLLVVFTIFFGTFYQSSAATQEELQKLIEALQNQIKYLQQQLSQLMAQQLKSCPFVTIGLSKGYFDEPTSEVKELQKLLKQDKSIYPEGLVTGYFGRLTEAALKRFQAKYNLSQSGIVDEATRQKLCEVYLSRFPSPTTTETITTTTSYPTPYLPDLTITEFYYSSSFPQPGQSVYFTLKVANSGLGDAPLSKLKVFLGSQIIYNTEIILKAGETKQFNFSWNCPSGTAGDYVFQAVIDKDNLINEVREDNNEKIIEICCGCVPTFAKPDLVVDSITMSATPEVGKPINFKIVIKNNGELQADSPIYVNLKVITAPSGVNAGSIGTLVYPSLSAGASEGELFDWQCIVPGYYTLEAEVDPYNYKIESNKNNNKKTISFSCTPQVIVQKPDLTIDINSNKTNLNVGETAFITLVERNIGNTQSGPYYSGVFEDNNTSPIPDSALGYDLAAGSSHTYSFVYKCNTAGDHTLVAKIDYKNQVQELKKDNNLASIIISCAPTSYPDLIITTIQLTPTNPKAGDYVNFVITEKNIGSASAGRHYIGWYQNNSPMGASLVYGLAPNATTNYSFSLQYAQAGSYSIKAKADVYNEVAESNESNNENTGSLTISPSSIYPTQTGCIKSPAYNGDLCSGYRLITSLEHSAACYNLDQCLAAQGNGTCVKSPVFEGDACSGYRVMPGISRACYSYSECQSALNNPVSLNLLETIQNRLVLIQETIKNLMVSLVNSVSREISNKKTTPPLF